VKGPRLPFRLLFLGRDIFWSMLRSRERCPWLCKLRRCDEVVRVWKGGAKNLQLHKHTIARSEKKKSTSNCLYRRLKWLMWRMHTYHAAEACARSKCGRNLLSNWVARTRMCAKQNYIQSNHGTDSSFGIVLMQ
jgi:hypothetical protein